MTTTTQSRGRVDINRDARDLYRAYLGLDRAVGNSVLPRELAELVRIRASQLNACAYCIDMHTRDALAGGDNPQRLFATAAWRESPLFSDRERAALALTEAATLIAEHRGLDDAYEQAADHFAADELAALLYTIVTINGWNRLAVTTHMIFQP